MTLLILGLLFVSCVCEGLHWLNLAKMEFHPSFSPSHGLHSAEEGVKHTRTYCLLKMRVASTPLHSTPITSTSSLQSIQQWTESERERREDREWRREKGITFPSCPVLLQSCQSKCQDSLDPSQASIFPKITQPPWDLDLEASRKDAP